MRKKTINNSPLRKEINKKKMARQQEILNYLVYFKGLFHVRKVTEVTEHDDVLKCSTCHEGYDDGEWVVHGRGANTFHLECAYNRLIKELPKMKAELKKKAVDRL